MGGDLSRSVVFTDVPWGDIELERSILEPAGIGAYLRGADEQEWNTRLSSADGILSCWDIVDRTMMHASPRLKLAARLGVGLDNFDLDAAEELGLVVTNVPDYCMHEVAEYVLAAAAGWARGLINYSTGSTATRVVMGPHRLSELTIGVWGLGRIGSLTASLFAGIGCRVLGYSNRPTDLAGVENVSLEELLRLSDVVTIHVPGGGENTGLLDEFRIAQLKPGALLVNAARGSVVDTAALAAALESGRLGGAVLDVVDGDPEMLARLAATGTCLVTPHIAFSSAVSERELRERACEDVIRVLNGERPVNQVIPRG